MHCTVSHSKLNFKTFSASSHSLYCNLKMYLDKMVDVKDRKTGLWKCQNMMKTVLKDGKTWFVVYIWFDVVLLWSYIIWLSNWKKSAGIRFISVYRCRPNYWCNNSCCTLKKESSKFTVCMCVLSMQTPNPLYYMSSVTRMFLLQAFSYVFPSYPISLHLLSHSIV